MRDILSLVMFGLTALCFAAFVVTVKPNAIDAVSGPGQGDYCGAGSLPSRGCRPYTFTAAPAGVVRLR